ncbi:hypothetical protein Sjap_021079 [Stephania japonica]|uniref:HMG box domain-containing protein n=1 Tax=Stephania japonica TaxID=461633 RepID=A0AAP0F1X9_9MAGN
MAESEAQMVVVNANPVPKKGRSRKALKAKNSSNEANILAGKAASSPLVPSGEILKQQETAFSPKTKKPSTKGKDFEKELQEMQEKLELLRLEKARTDDLLKTRDEMLKQREEELQTRGKEQVKLQLELKKLQKLKEFKPTMSFPLVQSLREKENEKKKKMNPEIKKPSTAYILWCKDQWNEVKKENPEADFKEVSNILGAKWKTLSSEEKKPYEEKYQADKEAYLQIMGKEKRENEAMKLFEEEQKQKTAMELLEQYLQFKQEVDKENMDKENKKKKEKDPLKPKQPLSAFFLYSKERRATLLEENKNVLEIAKITGEEWKNLTEKQRKPYEKIARKQKEEYLQEMEVYKQKKAEEAASRQQEEEELMKIQKLEAMQLLKKKEKTDNILKKTKEQCQKKKKEEQNVDPNKPKRPASSYILFSKETRKTWYRKGQASTTLH